MWESTEPQLKSSLAVALDPEDVGARVPILDLGKGGDRLGGGDEGQRQSPGDNKDSAALPCGSLS